MDHSIYDPEGPVMNKNNLIAAFEDAVLERDENENSETIKLYESAREALAEAIVENNPSLAVINYMLSENVDSRDDAMTFLRYWYEGEFDVLRRNWNNIPDAVFIGADPQFVPEEGE